jgi:hypothetical protein
MVHRLILLGLAACLMTGPAAAESPIAEVICIPRAELAQRLRGAELSGLGLRDTETVLEVWTKASGDWTLVQSYADGLACILAMGEAWEAVPPPPA